jgi:hypothetical protein
MERANPMTNFRTFPHGFRTASAWNFRNHSATIPHTEEELS